MTYAMDSGGMAGHVTWSLPAMIPEGNWERS
jgi:hypothetical protein